MRDVEESSPKHVNPHFAIKQNAWEVDQRVVDHSVNVNVIIACMYVIKNTNIIMIQQSTLFVFMYLLILQILIR